MTYEKLLVRVLSSCEAMANATAVCTNKTGTLTQNVMSAVTDSVGIHSKFVKNLQENLSRSSADEAEGKGRALQQLSTRELRSTPLHLRIPIST